MSTSYAVTRARPGRLVAIVVGTCGLATAGVALASDQTQGASTPAAIACTIAVALGATILLIRRWAVYRAVYSVVEDGVREEVYQRERLLGVRLIAWSEVLGFRAGAQGAGGLEYLRIRSGGGTIRVWSHPEGERKQAFHRFRNAAVEQLVARRVPRIRSSPVLNWLARGLGVAMAGILVWTLLLALRMPAAERPDAWWLRWLVLLGLGMPLIRRAFARPAPADEDCTTRREAP